MSTFSRIKIPLLILLLNLFLNKEVIPQKINWKAEIYSFFDNTEFGRSKFQIPQTMAGTRIAPEIGLRLDSNNRISGGVNLLHEFGSNKTVDDLALTAYYEFDKKPFRFMMGAFPRNYVLEKYPRIFFQDSLKYYRPNINGLFWEIHKNSNYLNVWLDWTSRQTQARHEAFFMGFSGKLNYGIFYIQHFGYMFHFAAVMKPVVDEALHDNGLFLTSAGIDLSEKTGLNKLDFNIGWVAGLERARSELPGWQKHNGLLFESRIEYKIIGLFNSFYSGGSQMKFYNDHGNELYWGDPIYRATTYNRSDFYINFIRIEKVRVRLSYSLHFTENRIYHEQSLTASFDLNKF